MFSPFRSWGKSEPGSVDPAAAPLMPEPALDATALAQQLQRDTSGLGLEAAQLRGTLEDSLGVADRQGQALLALVAHLQEIQSTQDAIQRHTADSLQSVSQAREAVDSVGREVAGVVNTLKDVAAAAQEITQIALQTRLVAFMPRSRPNAPAKQAEVFPWWPMPCGVWPLRSRPPPRPSWAP